MFDWTLSTISTNELIAIVDKKENVKELVGVEFNWLDSGIGGDLLLYSGKKFSILMNVNTKYIENESKISDFNWYTERTINILKKTYHISRYSFEFSY